ncbi:MAG: helix-turn-helix domain-containing protein [Dehalococcoidia bacterium]|jgi:excisionase family DNA binding protein|nr:helix-turn-helix domain-containing protein [Dehalococcoidia bacterium]
MEEYISVKQLSKRLNISLDTAYQYVHTAGFPAIKINKLIRIPVSSLEKWLDKRMRMSS